MPRSSLAAPLEARRKSRIAVARPLWLGSARFWWHRNQLDETQLSGRGLEKIGPHTKKLAFLTHRFSETPCLRRPECAVFNNSAIVSPIRPIFFATDRARREASFQKKKIEIRSRQTASRAAGNPQDNPNPLKRPVPHMQDLYMGERLRSVGGEKKIFLVSASPAHQLPSRFGDLPHGPLLSFQDWLGPNSG